MRGLRLDHVPVERERVEARRRGGADRDHARSVPPREPRPRGRGHRGGGHIEQRRRVGPQVQPRVPERPALVLEADRLVGAQQPHDDVEPLVEQAPRILLAQADHRAVGGQRARPHAQHHAPPRQVVELHDALGDPERVVVGDRHHARAQLDGARALRGHRDHQFGARADLGAGGVVLPEPHLVVGAAVEPLDQLEVLLQREGGVDAGLVEGGEEDAEAHPVVRAERAPPAARAVAAHGAVVHDRSSLGVRAG